MSDIKRLKYWCYKVLPLVYDESLSYYEVLCKVVTKLNEVIETSNKQGDEIKELQEAVNTLQEWVDNFDTSYAEEIIKEYLAKMIYVHISDDGYVVYYIPDEWDDIIFRTTGYDISNAELYEMGNVGDYEYGHLVLSFWGKTLSK